MVGLATTAFVVQGISASFWRFAPMMKLAFAVVRPGSFTIPSQFTVSSVLVGAIAILLIAAPCALV